MSLFRAMKEVFWPPSPDKSYQYGSFDISRGPLGGDTGGFSAPTLNQGLELIIERFQEAALLKQMEGSKYNVRPNS